MIGLAQVKHKPMDRNSYSQPSTDPSTTAGVAGVEWSDQHAIDHADTKAANEMAARNSDKVRHGRVAK